MHNNNTHWTCGFWPGRISVFGLDKLAANHSNMVYVTNEKENYFTYAVTNDSILTRFMMDSSGQLRQLTWEAVLQQWELNCAQPKQQCEIYSYDTECLIWKEDLLNIQHVSFSDNLGRDIHLRLVDKEVKAIKDQTKQRFKRVILGAAFAGTTIGLILGLSIWVCNQ